MAKYIPLKSLSFEEEVAARVKQYSALGAYKHLSSQELRETAETKVRLARLLRDLEIDTLFDDDDEKNEAVNLAEKYFNDYVFEFVSDKNTLKQLIFLEVLNKRIQRNLNEFYKDSQSVPTQIMEGLHKNLIQIIELKKILGLTKSDKEVGSSEANQALDLLKKKFKAWRKLNQGSRTIICPHCSKMVMLRIKTDAWEAQGHPYFIDRWLGSIPLFNLYKAGKITKKDCAEVLQTSEDYIDWISSKLQANSPEQLTNIKAKE
jgi:hypothetical protein